MSHVFLFLLFLQVYPRERRGETGPLKDLYLKERDALDTFDVPRGGRPVL